MRDNPLQALIAFRVQRRRDRRKTRERIPRGWNRCGRRRVPHDHIVGGEPSADAWERLQPPHARCSAVGLCDMRELVGKQTYSLGPIRRVLAGTEGNIVTLGIGAGAESIRRCACQRPGVHAHARQIRANDRLVERLHGSGQWRVVARGQAARQRRHRNTLRLQLGVGLIAVLHRRSARLLDDVVDLVLEQRVPAQGAGTPGEGGSVLTSGSPSGDLRSLSAWPDKGTIRVPVRGRGVHIGRPLTPSGRLRRPSLITARTASCAVEAILAGRGELDVAVGPSPRPLCTGAVIDTLVAVLEDLLLADRKAGRIRSAIRSHRSAA